MTDTEIDRAIDDVRQANEELFIQDLTPFANTGEENDFETYELDLASNLSSSTELADIKQRKNSTQSEKANENLSNR